MDLVDLVNKDSQSRALLDLLNIHNYYIVCSDMKEKTSLYQLNSNDYDCISCTVSGEAEDSS